MRAAATAGLSALMMVRAMMGAARADEICMSPYMARTAGQEDFVYV